MPKDKSKTKKYKKLKRTYLASILVIIILLSPFIISTIKQLSLKRDFSKLEKDILSIEQVAESETRVNFIKNKNCQRDSNKYAKGPLYCYLQLNSQISNYETSSILQTINNRLKIKNLNSGADHVKKYNNEGFMSEAFYYGKIKCVLSLKQLENDNEKSTLKLFCSAFSNQSFYPYRDN